jgi:heme A synthase
LTSLGIFAQAVIAGKFLDHRGQQGLIDTHNILANVIVVLALITAVVAWRLPAERRGPVFVGSVVLFVLLVIQTLVGHVVADHRGWLVVHVPLAMIVFGLTVWLSVQSALISRAARS